MKLLFALLSFLYLTSPAVKPVIQKPLKTIAVSNVTDDEKFPVLPDNISRLFYVQRSPNANTIVYELNTGKNGQLDLENPVHVYWIRYGELSPLE